MKADTCQHRLQKTTLGGYTRCKKNGYHVLITSLSSDGTYGYLRAETPHYHHCHRCSCSHWNQYCRGGLHPPLINQIHTQAADTASLVADAKAESVRAVFDQHQDLARQTASRSELARVMVEYNRGGNLALADLRTFSRPPRLDDAAKTSTTLPPSSGLMPVAPKLCASGLWTINFPLTCLCHPGLISSPTR